MRRAALALAGALLLAGCPIPQAVPDYPPGTVTPPRILSSTTTRASESLIAEPAGCPTDISVDLDARIFYPTDQTLEARWFVDYRPDQASRYAIQNSNREIPGNADPTVLERSVPTFTFHPYGYPPAPELGLGVDPKATGVVHVVELVVSNGFDDSNPPGSDPNRTPAVTDAGSRFEIQTYRWTFVLTTNVSCP